MAGTPMTITLYDPETDEVRQTYTRTFVPWRLLKAAIRLQGSLDPENMDEDDLNTMAGLVVEAFGNRFSVEDLNNGCDLSDMLSVLTMIIAKARNAIPNLQTGQG